MRRWRTVGVAVLALGLLAGCAGAPPRTTPISNGGNDDDLDQVVDAVRAASPGTEGKLWTDTTGNELPGDVDQWFLQTPRCWGSTDCADPVGSRELLTQISDTIAGARVSVNINTLWPYADGGFRDAIVDGLRRALAAGHRPVVRWLAGTPFFYSYTGDGPEAVRDQVLAALGPAAADLPLVVATTTSALTSWNHSKIVAVDGREAIVGGHNQWAADYLSATPVSDVSMKVRGPAAAAATRFADVTWGYVCDRQEEALPWRLLWVRYADTPAAAAAGCPRTLPVLDPGTPGSTRILAVGKLGNGINAPGQGLSSIPNNPLNDLCGPYGEDADFLARNPGLVANRELIASADQSVFIAQQDLLGTCPRYDQELFRILAHQIASDVNVTIVVSGAFFTAYSQMLSPYELSRTIFWQVLNQTGDLFTARDKVCRNLRLATVQVGPDATWPDGSRFAQHAKFIEVDGQVFKVGSNNLYPASLQEFDFLVDSPAATQQVREAYLDPLWTWSSRDAIIDVAQGRCDIFGL